MTNDEVEMEVEESGDEIQSDSNDDQEVAGPSKKLSKLAEEKKKESKPGIVYLSVIPPKMNVSQIREHFSQYGEIHRSFLQPDEKSKQRSRKNQTFTEGWIEFKKRRHAKKVAAMLNNTPLGGKKKKQNYDFLWNIKYLPGLRWVHINERLAYERISRQQRMRAEIAAAKRETSFFAQSVSLNKRLKKKKKNNTDGLKAEEHLADKLVDQDDNSANQSPSEQATGSNKNGSSKAIPSDRMKLFKMFFNQEKNDVNS